MVEQVKPLTQLDWQVIGRRCRRLQVPLPNSKDGLHTLAHRFAGLSEEMHRCARLATSDRAALIEAASLLKQANLMLLTLQRDWEREWREAQGVEVDPEEGQEHTVSTERTARAVRRENTLKVVD